jgi:5-formyltetrahydrofolate cyclo-ligase
MTMVDTKESVRKMIWDRMENDGLTKNDCHGRIPDFQGSGNAANLLRNTFEWKKASIIFVSPDTAQIKIRENVLLDNKLLIMASPKLLNGYLHVRPEDVKGNEEEASTILGAFKYGKKHLTIPHVDMVVEGSVAVDINGGRLGKGGGYGDMEISYLFDMGLIKSNTPIVSTVHELQFMENVPLESHDRRINMVVTPERVIRIDLISILKEGSVCLIDR